MQSSIRHLRMFQNLAATHSVTRTAELCHVSQPAVTQAMNKLEQEAAIPLLDRSSQGIFLTAAGEVMARRTRRALALLDGAMTDMARNIRFQATRPQLTALIAVTETENFTLAARRLGLAQPTVHRSTSLLEQSAGTRFFERTSHGLIATRAARQLAQAARLAFAELEQAEAELAMISGREVGRIVVGALPLSPNRLLPGAMLKFRRTRPDFQFSIVDGRDEDLLSGLRRGDIDLVLGAMPPEARTEGIRQEKLYQDSVAIVARPGHPILSCDRIGREELAQFPWVLPHLGTPVRMRLEPLLCADRRRAAIVTSSVTMLQDLLRDSDHLGALSRVQAEAEQQAKTLSTVPVELPDPAGTVAISMRSGWQPTEAQRQFVDLLRLEADALN